MKITREEFKELITLGREINEKSSAADGILNDDFVNELYFPFLYWISKSLGFNDEHPAGDLIIDCICDGCGWVYNENGELVSEEDLGKVYDTYFKDGNGKQVET